MKSSKVRKLPKLVTETKILGFVENEVYARPDSNRFTHGDELSTRMFSRNELYMIELEAPSEAHGWVDSGGTSDEIRITYIQLDEKGPSYLIEKKPSWL